MMLKTAALPRQQVKVQIGDMLQTRAICLDSIAPKTVFDNKRSNNSQAIEDVLLIVNRDVRDALNIFLREHDEMEPDFSEWMFDRKTPICLLHD